MNADTASMLIKSKFRWLALAVLIELVAALAALPLRHFYKDYNGPSGHTVAEVSIPEIYVVVFAVFSVVLWAIVLLFHWYRVRKGLAPS
jgi:hypothetical protein